MLLRSRLYYLALGALALLAVAERGFANPAQLAKGKEVYTMKACAGCHTIGGGDLSGPDLKNVSDRRPADWLKRWLKNPDEMFAAGDPTAQAMLKKYLTKMPNLSLTDEEIDAVIAYIAAESSGSKSGKKKGK